VDSFRIGCIGQLFEEQMRGVLAAVRAALDELDIADGAPRPEDLDKPEF
jgi:2-aminoethylphosphonate-pyruvate transaminase